MGAIRTFSGIMFDPLAPDRENINILDIAHALSLLCRANGHFQTFYSVGQHCINCALEAAARGCSLRVQLACLLHDGSEAYLSDVTRPVKQVLPKYLEIEAPLQDEIWRKWIGVLTEEERRLVFEIDDALLGNEFTALMGMKLCDPIPQLASRPQYAFPGFEATEHQYLALFRRLTERADGLLPKATQEGTAP